VLIAKSIEVLSPSHLRIPRKAKRHLNMMKNKYGNLNSIKLQYTCFGTLPKKITRYGLD
jgi:hypothetical protein